jgi:hypothetical protein
MVADGLVIAVVEACGDPRGIIIGGCTGRGVGAIREPSKCPFNILSG